MSHPTDPESRLLLAGQTWRAQQQLPPEPDLARMTGRGRSKVLMATAAAATVLLVAAGAIALLRGPGNLGGPAGGPGGVAESTPSTNLRSLDAVAVHNGGRVQAVGTVIVRPGKAAFLCVFGSIVPAGNDPADADCSAGLRVPLTGLNVRDLPDLHTYHGTRVSKAKVIGTYHDRTIAVTSVSMPSVLPSGTNLPPVQPPCAAPAGGWHSGPLADRTALDAYLSQHPDQFGGTDIGFPQGRPGGPTGPAGYTDVAQVIIVQVVTGDLHAVQAELAQRYPGNLCLHRNQYSTTAMNGAASEVQRLLVNQHAAALAMGAGPTQVFADIPVVDDTLYSGLAAIESRYGAGILSLDVAIRPAS
jgi:hypothetical protein